MSVLSSSVTFRGRAQLPLEPQQRSPLETLNARQGGSSQEHIRSPAREARDGRVPRASPEGRGGGDRRAEGRRRISSGRRLFLHLREQKLGVVLLRALQVPGISREEH